MGSWGGFNKGYRNEEVSEVRGKLDDCGVLKFKWRKCLRGSKWLIILNVVEG